MQAVAAEAKVEGALDVSMGALAPRFLAGVAVLASSADFLVLSRPSPAHAKEEDVALHQANLDDNKRKSERREVG